MSAVDATEVLAGPVSRAAGHWQIAWRRLRCDRVAVVSGCVLFLLLLAVFPGAPLAERLLGHGPNDFFPYAVSTTLRPVGPLAVIPDTPQLGDDDPTPFEHAPPPPGTKNTLLLLGADSQLGRDEFLRLLVAVPLGALAATRPRSWIDRTAIVASLAAISTHPLVVGLLLQLFAGNRWHLAPPAGYCTIGHPSAAAKAEAARDGVELCGGVGHWASHLVLPWITFALFFVALYMRMVRSQMLEVLGEQYVRTARAKGRVGAAGRAATCPSERDGADRDDARHGRRDGRRDRPLHRDRVRPARARPDDDRRAPGHPGLRPAGDHGGDAGRCCRDHRAQPRGRSRAARPRPAHRGGARARAPCSAGWSEVRSALQRLERSRRRLPSGLCHRAALREAPVT